MKIPKVMIKATSGVCPPSQQIEAMEQCEEEQHYHLQVSAHLCKGTTWSRSRVCCLVTQVCPALCGPMDSSLPSSTVHGILQARILEWVAISFSNKPYTMGIYAV